MTKHSIRYSEENRSANLLASEYGVTVSTITKWIHQSYLTVRLLLLKNMHDWKRKKEGLEILKQAAVLLAKH